MTVTLPGIHDGELRRIEIPGDKSLSLTYESIDRRFPWRIGAVM